MACHKRVPYSCSTVHQIAILNVVQHTLFAALVSLHFYQVLTSSVVLENAATIDTNKDEQCFFSSPNVFGIMFLTLFTYP